MTVEVRLHGSEDECRQAAARLPAIGEVLSVSRPRRDHGGSRLVRVYAEVRLTAAPQPPRQPPSPCEEEVRR